MFNTFKKIITLKVRSRNSCQDLTLRERNFLNDDESLIIIMEETSSVVFQSGHISK